MENFTRYDAEIKFTYDKSGEWVNYEEAKEAISELENQVASLEHQVGELEDQVFELTRQLAGKE
jgi:chaperonin cofactor prefoldin